MDKFLEAHNLPRLNHEVIEKLNKPTTRGLINNQKPPHIENPETWVHWKMSPNIQRTSNTNPSQNLQNMQEEGTLPNSL